MRAKMYTHRVDTWQRGYFQTVSCFCIYSIFGHALRPFIAFEYIYTSIWVLFLYSKHYAVFTVWSNFYFPILCFASHSLCDPSHSFSRNKVIPLILCRRTDTENALMYNNSCWSHIGYLNINKYFLFIFQHKFANE